LHEAGYTVGIFTSPHLSRFSERIRIDKKEIAKNDVLSLIKEIKKHCEMMTKKSQENHPTFFEFVTAMAFMYFKRKNVDFVVLEVGLGGRLDSTNVVEPLVSVITNVTKDHTDVLGKDLVQIAKEKAGIIKQNSIFITASNEPEVLSIFKKKCMEMKTKMYNVNDFFIKQKEASLDGLTFDIKTSSRYYRNLFIKLLGRHQIVNTAVAIAVSEILNKFGITEDDIKKGLSKTEWPGRMEIVSKKPLIIFDSAHNLDAIEKLKDTFTSNIFNYDKMILILAISSNKDIEKIVTTIVPLADIVIITKHDVKDRSADQNKIREYVDNSKETIIISTVKEALNKAMKIAGDNDVICVTGSLFTVGEAREAWFNKKPEGLRLGM